VQLGVSRLLRLRSFAGTAALAILAAAACLIAVPQGNGQMQPDTVSEQNGWALLATPGPAGSELPVPIARLDIPQPVRAGMMVSPPFGVAPLTVGFFVTATDPDGQGFLTYSWNFGDGTVSSLPPEMHIAHTYQKPGSYVCELTMTTVDGRKATVFQGVVVSPVTH